MGWFPATWGAGAATYHAGSTVSNNQKVTLTATLSTKKTLTSIPSFSVTCNIYGTFAGVSGYGGFTILTISDADTILSATPSKAPSGIAFAASISGNQVIVAAGGGTSGQVIPGAVTVKYVSKTYASGTASWSCPTGYTIDSYDYIQGLSPSDVSISGRTITVTLEGPYYGTEQSTILQVYYSYYSSGYYSGVTRTIDLGEDKYVTAVSVVSKSPSGATVTPTKTEHGASVYLYQNSSSTINATIKLEYYYYDTVKEAKVKHNGTIYKHIKYNGEIIV